jgi:hypothetical protein
MKKQKGRPWLPLRWKLKQTIGNRRGEEQSKRIEGRKYRKLNPALSLSPDSSRIGKHQKKKKKQENRGEWDWK